MEKLTEIMNKIGLPFAYDHFAEGESPDPPFICYLTPNSDNFAADGQVYYKINKIRTVYRLQGLVGRTAYRSRAQSAWHFL